MVDLRYNVFIYLGFLDWILKLLDSHNMLPHLHISDVGQTLHGVQWAMVNNFTHWPGNANYTFV
jgi:hypothetical protein